MQFEIGTDITDDIHLIGRTVLASSIVINKKQFSITECEVYWNDQKNHKDEFAHKHEMPAGQWRIHPSGIDITLSSSEAFGGILIRGLMDGNNNIDGPWRCLERLVGEIGSVTQPNLPILELAASPVDDFITSPRVGLSVKSSDESKFQYLFENYRFQKLQDDKPISKIDTCLTFLANQQEDWAQNRNDATRKGWLEYFNEGKNNFSAHRPLAWRTVADKCRNYGFWSNRRF